MTKVDTWTCKSCGAVNEISEVLAEPLRQQLAAEMIPQIQAQELEKVSDRLAELEGALNFVKAENRELKDNEVTLREDRRKLEADKEDHELVVQRALDEKREELTQQAEERSAERYKLRIQEQDEKIARLTRDLDAAQQRLHQTPSELRGAVQEMALFEALKVRLPEDDFTRFGKGRRGADVLQQVRDKAGVIVGVVLWERKQAKEWDKTWLPKLREDIRTASAAVGVLVSAVIPEGRAYMSDGVIVVQPEDVDFIAELLRNHILAVAQTRSASELGDAPRDRVWEYVSAGRLWQRLQGISEPMIAEWNAIQKDEESDERRNSRRKENLRRQARHVAGLCGDLQAIGAELPEVPLLELPTGT